MSRRLVPSDTAVGRPKNLPPSGVQSLPAGVHALPIHDFMYIWLSPPIARTVSWPEPHEMAVGEIDWNEPPRFSQPVFDGYHDEPPHALCHIPPSVPTPKM